MNRRSRIYATVKKIPRGRVATYGQIARLAGLGRRARQVGYALSALPDGAKDIPWQRVINSRGTISPRAVPYAVERQQTLLKKEGVVLDSRGRISLNRYQWKL